MKSIKSHRRPFVLKKPCTLFQMSEMPLGLDSCSSLSSQETFQNVWFEIRTLKSLLLFHFLSIKWVVKVKFLLSQALLTTAAKNT